MYFSPKDSQENGLDANGSGASKNSNDIDEDTQATNNDSSQTDVLTNASFNAKIDDDDSEDAASEDDDKDPYSFSDEDSSSFAGGGSRFPTAMPASDKSDSTAVESR